MTPLEAANIAKAAYNAGDFTVVGNVLSFRGSDDLGDWIKDLELYEIKQHVEYPGLVHDGFATRLALLWPRIISKIPQNGDLVIVGHSLGGALATLASVRLKDAGYATTVFTFGSPRVGNSVFSAAYKCDHFRFVNRADIVPHLPPFKVIGEQYLHVNTLKWIDFNGRLALENEHYLLEAIESRDMVIEDHYIENYIAAIAKLGVQS
jgi:triacylglycerol lipase